MGGGGMVVIQGFHLSGPFRGPLLPTAFFLHRSLHRPSGKWPSREPGCSWALGGGGSDPAHSLEGQQPNLPDGSLSKEEESGLSGQAAWRAWLLLSSEVEHVFLGTARGKWWGAGAQAEFLP